MKTLKCDMCETTAEAETFEQWMEKMMPHYQDAHAEMMQKMSEMTEEEQKASKAKWMEEMNAKFESA